MQKLKTRLVSVLSFVFFCLGLAMLMQTDCYAVPAFARQMEAGCDLCHYQHFPELNSFGRAFKLSAFTMIGSQKKIEDKTISIPAVLNAGIFTNLRYQKTNGPTESPTSSNNGEWIIPSETSLFLGGRVGEHVGYLIEGDLPDTGISSGSSFLASFKIPFIYDFGDTHVGATAFSSGLGPSYALEVMNTGAVGNHIISLVHPGAVSAQQYIGTGTDSEGIALTATQGDWFAVVARWSPNRLGEHAGTQRVGLNSNYFRAAYLPQIGNWDLGIGVQYWGGSTFLAQDAATPNVALDTKAAAFDAQAQGTIGGMPVGFYLTFARAPGDNAGIPNLFGANATAGAEAGVDPSTVGGLPNASHAAIFAAEAGVFSDGRGTVQFAYRRAVNGQGPDPVDGNTYDGDNALTLAVGYKFAQNIFGNVTYTKFSGSAYDQGNSLLAQQSTGGGSGLGGDQLITVNLGLGF